MNELRHIGDTYLFKKYNKYSEVMFKFIMNGYTIDVNSEAFEYIMMDIKRRQISNSLIDVCKKDVVRLTISNNPLPNQFKVFIAKDVKAGNGKNVIYIDCTGLIENDGSYKCNDIDILIAYLVNAQTHYVYYSNPNKILLNNQFITELTYCFSILFTHIVDYSAKISTVQNLRNKCLYLSAMYCLIYLLDKDDTIEQTKAVARRISGISPREEEIIISMIPADTYKGLPEFIEALRECLNVKEKVSLDLICERWMWIYGVGTVFGLELFTSLASMITNAYTGCYINNQNTIEKLTGQHMVMATKLLLEIGSANIK